MSTGVLADLNLLGLALAFAGSFALLFLNKISITIKEDGTQSWGAPPGMSNEDWLKSNIRYRKQQKYGIPAAYIALSLGFLCQLVSAWPK